MKLMLRNVGTAFACLWIWINQLPAAELPTIDLTQWTPPDIATVGDDPFGKLVKYGHALFTDTANEIGPAVSDVNVLPATISPAKTAMCRPAPSP